MTTPCVFTIAEEEDITFPFRLIIFTHSHERIHFLFMCADGKSKDSGEAWTWRRESLVTVKPIHGLESTLRHVLYAKDGFGMIQCRWFEPESQLTSQYIQSAHWGSARVTQALTFYAAVKPRHEMTGNVSDEYSQLLVAPVPGDTASGKSIPQRPNLSLLRRAL